MKQTNFDRANEINNQISNLNSKVKHWKEIKPRIKCGNTFKLKVRAHGDYGERIIEMDIPTDYIRHRINLDILKGEDKIKRLKAEFVGL